jgi:hypothetical protein
MIFTDPEDHHVGVNWVANDQAAYWGAAARLAAVTRIGPLV